MFYEKLAEAKRDKKERRGLGGYLAGAPLALGGAHLAVKHMYDKPNAEYTARFEPEHAKYEQDMGRIRDEVRDLRYKQQGLPPQFLEMEPYEVTPREETLQGAQRRALSGFGASEDQLDQLKSMLDRHSVTLDVEGPEMTERHAESILAGVDRLRRISDRIASQQGLGRLRQIEFDTLNQQLTSDLDEAIKQRRGGAGLRLGLGLAGAYGAKRMYDRFKRPKQRED